MTFISCLYGVIYNDKKITQECGLIDLLESGDMVKSIGGFDIQNLLASKCIYQLFCEENSSCYLKRK